MTDIVERLRNTEFAFEPPLKAIDLMEEAADEIERLRAALKMWQEAVWVDAKMGGPVYMGVSSRLGRKAWEATLAAITGGKDD